MSLHFSDNEFSFQLPNLVDRVISNLTEGSTMAFGQFVKSDTRVGLPQVYCKDMVNVYDQTKFTLLVANFIHYGCEDNTEQS